MSIRHSILLAIAAIPALTAPGSAQGPRPGPTVDWTKVPERIAWYGTLKGALAAASRTGRPILLVSAAPHCNHISGVW